MDFRREAEALLLWMTEHRRYFHRHPEPGNREFLTAAHIEETLRELGLKPKRYLETAVIADIVGERPGKTVALRADMDALPLTEQTGLDYASEHPGYMHACGHDLHMAALLGTAKLLSDHRDELYGTVRMIFQPDEEMNGGAERLVAAGVMEGVDWVFGTHVKPELPTGTVCLRHGAFYAASNPFTITVHGQSSHGAEPEKGRDALMAGCQIVSALQTLISRRTSPTEPAVLTVGTFQAGTQCNILAAEAVLTGILRTFGEEARHRLTSAMEETVRQTAEAMDTTAEIAITWGYPGVVNDDRGNDLVSQAAKKLGFTVVEAVAPTMTTEDFGYYLQKVPGCYWNIGVDSPSPVHSETFLPEESALAVAAAIHAQTVFQANQA